MSSNSIENNVMMGVVAGLASPPPSWIGSVCTGNSTLWVGFTCSSEGNVTKINIPKLLPPGASINVFNDIYKLESLSYIDVSMNGLTGMSVIRNS